MKHAMTVPGQIKFKQYSNQTVLDIGFEAPNIAGFCLGLCLLEKGLASRVVIHDKSERVKLRLQSIKQPGQQPRTSIKVEGQVVDVSMSANDLDCILYFYLKYIRDGMAEVDHLDIAVHSDDKYPDPTLTVRAPQWVEPVTLDEAKRRLGLQ
jgi:hypothetical protein